MSFLLANTFDNEVCGTKVRVKAIVLTALLLLVVPVASPFGGDGTGTAAYAQQRGTNLDRQRTQPQQNSRTGTSDLPDWARPQEQTSRHQRQRQSEMRTKGGPPVDEPPGNRNVPLGGLEWLILAGAGYGLFKLRDDE